MPEFLPPLNTHGRSAIRGKGRLPVFTAGLAVAALALLLAGSLSADGDPEPSTGSVWDWNVAKEPSRVLAGVLLGAQPGGGVLLLLERGARAPRFWHRLAEEPVADRTPAIAFTFEGSERVAGPFWRRDALSHALTKARPPATPSLRPTPFDALERAVAWAQEFLPPPRAVLYVTTRPSAEPRGRLEAFIARCKTADCRVSVVVPEAAFSDNAHTILHLPEPAGEAPIEEVPFDWDLNLPALWIAPVAYGRRSAEAVPTDVRQDPWRGDPWVRMRGYGLVPSGFADYAFSRCARETGGRVYLHAFTPRAKAKCTITMDPGRFRRLAPSLLSKRAYGGWRRADANARRYDRAISILHRPPGLLARSVDAARRKAPPAGFVPLPIRFHSRAGIATAVKLARRKDALAKRAIGMLEPLVEPYRAAEASERFRAHAVLLTAWLWRVRFHLLQYVEATKAADVNARMQSGVSVTLYPDVIWHFCFGTSGALQRGLGYDGGEEARRLVESVVDSTRRVRRGFRDTPWEVASKLGFLVRYRLRWGDGRVRGPMPSTGTGGGSTTPTTPPSKPTAPTTPPPRPPVGGGGTGGPVTGR